MEKTNFRDLLLNDQKETQTIELKKSFIDIESDTNVTGEMILRPYEVKILKNK